VKSIALRVALVVVSLTLVACGGDDKGSIFGVAPTDGPMYGPTSSVLTTIAGRTATAGPARTPTPAARTPTPDNANREDWQTAMLDTSTRLPGEYVAPHPGADGVVCADISCTNRHDDRNHFNAAIPICTAAQLSAKNYSTPLCYHSNPPTSGPHAGTFATNRVYEEPVPKEQLVHAMEHSSVIIWYNTNDQTVIRQLAAVANGANQSRKFVVMSRYEGMEANTIALTSWTRLDKFPVSQFRDQRVLDFINAHSRRYNPEGF
jgi:hypothetical protein